MSSGNLQDALLALAKTPLAHLDAARDHLLATSASALGVARAGLWHFLPGKLGIVAQRMYAPGTGFVPVETVLLAEQCPSYFAALESTLALAATDARADAATRELAPHYLEPNRIGAMLDVPVRAFGRTIGIICHEHVGGTREWSEAEQTFAAAVGMLASLAYERDEHRRAELAHENRRLYDALTALPSRSLFVDRVQQALASDRHIAVLALDLERFKVINESLGHVYGDAVLMEVARRLQATVPPQVSLARLGNDEFAILMERIGEPLQTMRLAERVLEALAKPFRMGGQTLALGASIGIALARPDSEPGGVLQDAETALNRARSHGGSRYEMFDASMYRASVERMRLDADLRASLDADEFIALFQPIVSLTDGQPIGFEALLRWRRAEQGLVLPASFIPASEQNGLIGRMGQRVLEQALKALSTWRAMGPEWQNLSVHVNVSPVQLALPGLADEIGACLQRHGLPGEALVVEITESSLLEASQQILDTLDRLRALHVRLHLDDFGTGYGFLTHLRELPITAMKIDRSFTAALPGDRAAAAIVASLIRLAHGLGLEVVAEGVEQPAQLKFLREQGCNAAQGYWLCRPVPAEAIDAPWLERLRQHAAADSLDSVGRASASG